MNKLLMKSLKPAILITDRNGRIMSADALACQLFAGAETTLPGKDFHRLLDTGLAGPVMDVMTARSQLIMLPVAGSLMPYQLTISEMIPEQNGLFVILIYPAVTPGPPEPAGAERAGLLAQAVATLEQAKDEVQTSLLREMEVSRLKTRFISLASHEFRSPLSSIQLSVALIERYYDRLERDKVFFHLRKIRLAIGDLTGILEDFLSLERIDTGKLDLHFEKIDLPAFCKELLLEMELSRKEGQQFHYEHHGQPVYFVLDRKVLRHCLINLLSNAIKYSGEGALISLSTRISDDGCHIVVADNGLGIPAEDQPHIFEPFFRAGNVIDRQGTGLGLSIVRRYCGLMNGTVNFKSLERQGTTFTIWFPESYLQASPG